MLKKEIAEVRDLFEAKPRKTKKVLLEEGRTSANQIFKEY